MHLDSRGGQGNFSAVLASNRRRQGQLPKSAFIHFLHLAETQIFPPGKQSINTRNFRLIQKISVIGLSPLTRKAHLAVMYIFVVAALSVFADVALAIPLTTLSTLGDEINSFSPRSALHELRKRVEGTECTSPPSVRDPILPQSLRFPVC